MNESKSSAELNTPESLQVARAYAGLLGEIPSSFSTTLRTLINDEEKNAGKLSLAGRFLALRLLKSRGVLSPIYYAALTFRGAQLTALGAPTPENIIKVFSPMDLAGLIGLLYLYRRLKSFVAESIWKDGQAPVVSGLEVGAHLGIAMPRIGMAMGACVGGLGQFGFHLFSKQDEKAFKEYRRYLRTSKLPFDLQTEMTTWGCTRFNVGAVLLQIMGFGVPVANAYSPGLSCKDPLGKGLSPEAYRFKIAAIWHESLVDTGLIPNMAHKGEYYPTQAAASMLLQEVGIVRQQGTRYAFLDKSKDDISPEKTPQLFPGTPPPAPKEEADVPEELARQIKDEEIEKI